MDTDTDGDGPKGLKGRMALVEGATRTARKTYQVLDLLVERMHTKVLEADGDVRLDRETTVAMLNLQRMAAGLIDAHPGLLAEVRGEGAEPEASDEELEGMLKSLGV